MMPNTAFLASSLGAAGVAFWIASFAMAIRLHVLRGQSLGKGLPLAIVLGPLWAMIQLVQVIRNPRNLENNKPIRLRQKGFEGVFGPIAVVLGALLVAGSLIAGKTIGSEVMGLQGEPLQFPIVHALWLGGLLGGVVIGRRTQRIGFLESLWVVFLVSCLPALFYKDLSSLFTYGTAAAYFVLVCFAGALILAVSLVIGGAIGFLTSADKQSKRSWAYESWIGRRFLMGKRTSNVVSLITVLSVFAVVVGTSGMVVVMSVMNGFSSDLRSKILGANAHLLVMKYGVDFVEYPEVMKKTRQVPGVIGATPFIINEVMISSDINLTGALIKGVDIRTVNEVTVLGDNMTDGRLQYLKSPEKIPDCEISQTIRTKSKRTGATGPRNRFGTSNSGCRRRGPFSGNGSGDGRDSSGSKSKGRGIARNNYRAGNGEKLKSIYGRCGQRCQPRG